MSTLPVFATKPATPVAGWRLLPANVYNCCTQHREPVWSRFTALTISGVRDLRRGTGDGSETECVACDDSEAEFWTVYGRTKGGDVEAITDAPTKAAALVMVGYHLARALVAGVRLDFEEWAALSAPEARK